MVMAVSGLFACGIFLLNLDATLDHEFVHSETLWRKADIFFRGHKNWAIIYSIEDPVNSGSSQRRRQKQTLSMAESARTAALSKRG
jgi:hypothetical protein